MTLQWSRTALADLMAIQAFIAEDSPAIARSFAARLVAAANSLETLPRRGRPGRAPTTLELVVPGTPYIIVYRLKGELVQIAAIAHAARRG